MPQNAPGVRRYCFSYTQPTAYPYESGQLLLTDFAPQIPLSSFKDCADFGAGLPGPCKQMAAVTPAITSLSQKLVSGVLNERDKEGSDCLAKHTAARFAGAVFLK